MFAQQSVANIAEKLCDTTLNVLCRMSTANMSSDVDKAKNMDNNHCSKS